MSGSDHEKSFCQKHFAAIEETDEDVQLEEMEDSDCDILSGVDVQMKELKIEVRTKISNILFTLVCPSM